VIYQDVTESEATYIGRGSEARGVCDHGRPHIYIFYRIFGKNNMTNQSVKADVQLSLVEVGFVPKGDPRNMNVSCDLRPIRDTRNPEELL
jgi:hypothetical protein